MQRLAAELDSRAARGCVVEAHGDLRPEHVCLLPEPQIIDCLEFSRDFRILDPADELAFLALECERLGDPGRHHPQIGRARHTDGMKGIHDAPDRAEQPDERRDARRRGQERHAVFELVDLERRCAQQRPVERLKGTAAILRKLVALAEPAKAA